MTRREHFESWMKSRFPYMPLSHGEAEDFYYHDMVQFMWMAWQESPNRRPTTNNKITKEQLAAMKEDDPTTIVDRLNGIYGSAVEPYPVPNVQKEAAREIERLRKEIEFLTSESERICLIEEIERLKAEIDGITVTTDHLGVVGAVTITNDEHQIQRVIWERGQSPAVPLKRFNADGELVLEKP